MGQTGAQDVPDAESERERTGSQREIPCADGSDAGRRFALPLQRRMDPFGQSGTAVAVQDLHASRFARYRRPVDEARNLLPESQTHQQHHGSTRTRRLLFKKKKALRIFHNFMSSLMGIEPGPI